MAEIWEVVVPNEVHLHDVLANASKITLQELRDFSLTHYDVTDNWRAGDKGEALLINGRAQCILAHNPAPERGASVRNFWFICTEGYWAAGLRGIKFTRDYLIRLRRFNPQTVFESYTLSTHEDMRRWFGVLGFEPIGTLGGTQAFTLPPLRAKEPA